MADAHAQEHDADLANGTSMQPLGVLRQVCVATPAFAGHWFGDGFSLDAVKLAPAVVAEPGLLASFLARQLNFPYPSLLALGDKDLAHFGKEESRINSWRQSVQLRHSGQPKCSTNMASGP